MSLPKLQPSADVRVIIFDPGPAAIPDRHSVDLSHAKYHEIAHSELVGSFFTGAEALVPTVQRIVDRLSQVAAVVAVYADRADDSVCHVWTVIREDEESQFISVYGAEKDLYRAFGEDCDIDFHVVPADYFKAGRRIQLYKR